MTLWCARVLALIVCTVLTSPLHARMIWVVEQARVVRVDTATATLRALDLGDVRGVAPKADGGAWILRAESFAALDASMAEVRVVPMEPSDLESVGPMAVEVKSGSLWVGVGHRVVHVTTSGDRRDIAVLPGAIRAIAIAGPDAVFVASDSLLVRYDSEGRPVARFDLERVPGGQVRGVGIDPLAGLLWLVRDGMALQLDVLAGISLRTSIGIRDPHAVVVDAATGHLTVLVDGVVARYGRDGTALRAVAVADEIREVAGIELSRGSDWLWLGDRLGLGLIDVNDGSLVRVPGMRGVMRLAAAPPRFSGVLDAEADSSNHASAATRIALRYSAACDEDACLPTLAFLHALRIEAELGGRDVASAFRLEPSGDTYRATLPVAASASGVVLGAVAVDAFGNRSEPATVNWPVAPAQSPAGLGPKAGTPPTIAITAPVNNATYTAPLSTTLKVAAVAGSGATIVKVEYFANGALVGAVTAAPYDLAWSNVQPGTYALTAKVTDSTSANATSAAVTVIINAGAPAKPVDAWLFNDAWTTATPIADAAGTRDGVATGSVSAVTSNGSAPKPATCKAAAFASPGGTIDVTGLAISTAAGARTTLAFWMYWNGADDVMPASWASEAIVLRSGWLGFTTQGGDVHGVASTGLANKWTHVVAEFANGGVASNKLYINGVPQALAQRVGTPTLANAVVSTSLRFGGQFNTTTSRFIGQLDEVKLWTRALTAVEVSAEFALANACDTAPTATLTQPANNANFVAPASIALAATAASGSVDATLARVDFYNGTALLATKIAAPFTYTWASVPVGTYRLTAKATDSKGSRTTTAVTTVNVKANVAPAVTVTAPANNTIFNAPTTINLAASATDGDGTVAKVEFYQGATRLATITSPPYSYSWTNVAGGTYTITAKATDNLGAVTTSTAVTVVVNKPPVVSITSPANNATFVAPSTVVVAASASDPDGSIAKVEFYRDGVLVASDTAAPYSFSWTAQLGTYVLVAKATDNRGSVTSSSPVTINVKVAQPPGVSITSPANGAKVRVQVPFPVDVSASDADGSIAKVEAYWLIDGNYVLIGSDTTAPYSVPADLVTEPYIPQLLARAYDNHGLSTFSAPVQVVANEPPYVWFEQPTIWEVVSPSVQPDVKFNASAADLDGGSIRTVRIYKRSYEADGGTGAGGDPAPVLLGTFTAPPYEVTWRSVPHTVASGPGIAVHGVWAEATDDTGDVTTTDEMPLFVWATSQASTETLTIVQPDRNVPLVFVSPATIVLVGEALASSVEWFANGTSIGSTPAANGSHGEFAFTWRNVPAGTYAITTRFVDGYGRVGTATDGVTITVKGAEEPVVAVTSPAPDSASVALQQTPLPVAATASYLPPGAKVRFTNRYAYVADTSGPHAATIPSIDRGLNVVAAQAIAPNGAPLSDAARAYVVGVPTSRPPIGVVTSPSPTGSYTTATPITFAVDAKAPDGSILAVELYEGSTQFAKLTSPPYSYTATRPIGTFTVHAVVASSGGGRTSTTPVTFRVVTTDPDVGVEVTSPIAGQRVVVPSSLPLSVRLTDPNRKVLQVTYLVTIGTMLAGPLTVNSPYTANWPVNSAGSYSVVARARTQNGYVDSEPVTFTAAANQAPSVVITSPSSGQAFFAGQPIPITVTAADVDGVVSKVEYFTSTGTLLGTATTAPFTFTWSPTVAGTYTIYAKATDDRGAASQSATVNSIRIDPNAIPQVRMISPQSGNAYGAGGIINLAATATDADGSIVRMDFYAGSTLLGSSSVAPYALAWSGAAAGSYALSARAVDNRGGVGVSAPVNVTVQAMAITIASPADGATVSADFVTVSGTYQGPPNSGVTVNGMVAGTDGVGNFYLNNVPLTLGANAIAVTLETAEGASVSVTRTVTSSARALFQVTVEPDGAYAPAIAVIRVNQQGAMPWQNIAVSGLGSATLDTTGMTPSVPGRITFSNPGVYRPRVVLTDATGAVYEQTLTVVIKDRATYSNLVKEAWNRFTRALAAGDKQSALEMLNGGAPDRYRGVFDTLEASLPQIVANWSTPRAGRMGEDIAELTVARNIDGVKRLFFIYLLRDRKGIWRVDSM